MWTVSEWGGKMTDNDDRTLEYINDMVKQLGDMTDSPDLSHLRYLLQMAEMESAETIKKRKRLQPERAEIKSA
jgi:hypothetical protein